MGMESRPISNFCCFTLYRFFSATLPDQKDLICDWTRYASKEVIDTVLILALTINLRS